MIIQPTLEQTRRINRKRTYSGPGFGPRSFECFGMSLTLGIGLSSASGASKAQSVIAIMGSAAWIVDASAPDNTIGGGTLGTAKDQTGNGYDFTAPGSAPLYSATGGPTGGPYFSTVLATTRYLRNTVYAAPTAGTTPLFVYWIGRLTTWSTGSFFAAKTGTGLPKVEGSTTGKFAAFNGVTGPEVALATGSWFRGYVKFNNSASVDKLRLGAADSGVGTALGNTASGAGFFIGISNTMIDADFSFMFASHVNPSGAQLTALDSALASGCIV